MKVISNVVFSSTNERVKVNRHLCLLIPACAALRENSLSLAVFHRLDQGRVEVFIRTTALWV